MIESLSNQWKQCMLGQSVPLIVLFHAVLNFQGHFHVPSKILLYMLELSWNQSKIIQNVLFPHIIVLHIEYGTWKWWWCDDTTANSFWEAHFGPVGSWARWDSPMHSFFTHFIGLQPTKNLAAMPKKYKVQCEDWVNWLKASPDRWLVLLINDCVSQHLWLSCHRIHSCVRQAMHILSLRINSNTILSWPRLHERLPVDWLSAHQQKSL